MSQCCEGSWIDCIQSPNYVDGEYGKHGFFRHIPKCIHFDRNDVAKLCPICWQQAQIKNGTVKVAPRAQLENAWREHLSKNKPMKDSL